MNHTQREIATNPAFTLRETREENPYERIVYAGSASNRYQISRRAWIHDRAKNISWGSYSDLESAIAARDALPIDIQPSELKPAIPPHQPTRQQWWEE